MRCSGESSTAQPQPAPHGSGIAVGCRVHCWLGWLRVLRCTREEDEEEVCAQQRQVELEGDEIPEPQHGHGYIVYKDRHEAISELKLEGGEGDPVYIFRIKEGSRAALSGARPGDEIVQVNLASPAVMFRKPAEDILPSIVGSIVIWWKRTPPRPEGECTRIHKRYALKWDQEEWHDGVEIEPWPKSKAITLPDKEWGCGSCEAVNFDCQEFCRRCGLRDSRLPKRPGKPNHLRITSDKTISVLNCPNPGLTNKDLVDAVYDGMDRSQKI